MMQHRAHASAPPAPHAGPVRVQEHLLEVTSMADAAKRSLTECQRASESRSSSIASKDEAARALQRRADAAEASRAAAGAEGAAPRAARESRVAGVTSKAAGPRARASDVHGRLDEERQTREKLEADARQAGLLRHVPRPPGAAGEHAAAHTGELAPMLEQVSGGGGAELGRTLFCGSRVVVRGSCAMAPAGHETRNWARVQLPSARPPAGGSKPQPLQLQARFSVALADGA